MSESRPMKIDPRDDRSPFGISSSSEWLDAFPRFMPLSAEAGATWFRLWPEWGGVQPRPGEFRWDTSDRMLAVARAAQARIAGILFYMAPWASADGKSSRAFPIRDIEHWRAYVRATMTRYRDDIRYWEIWNEYNSPGFNQNGKAADYAQLVRETQRIARDIDPELKIGISCANFDVQFLDEVIRAGAADHFDFVAVHPYEAFGAVLYGEEAAFLAQARTLREMLAANDQPADLPLWVTECGDEAPIRPDSAADQRQAEAVVKLYTLTLAQGFDRIFWFEARGPAYGTGTDFGLIREDWTLRPSWYAYRTMTTLLGPEPRFLGWTKMAGDGYGFLFAGRAGKVLVAWAPIGERRALSFDAPVRVTDLAGRVESDVRTWRLTHAPIFITDAPEPLVKEAEANAGKPFTFHGDHSQAKAVVCRLGAPAAGQGLRRVWFRKDNENCTEPATVDGEPCVKVTSVDKDRNAVYFRADPSFLPYGPRKLKVTVVARRVSADAPAEVGLVYESTTRVNNYFLRYRPADTQWSIPGEDAWHEHTWTLDDAHFLGQWGWNLGLKRLSGDYLLKEVRVEG